MRRASHRHVGSRRSAVGLTGTSVGARLRIAAREQRDVVPEAHERVGQVGDDALGAAVCFRRHAFDQRGNLCNTHPSTHSGCMGGGVWCTFQAPQAMNNPSADRPSPRRSQARHVPAVPLMTKCHCE